MNLGQEQPTAGIAEDTDSPIPMAADVRPRTITVLGLLSLTALTFSFIGSYAAYNALVSAGLIQKFTGRDPRPKWLLIGFCVLMLVFMGVGEFFRFLSKRQFKAIDAMADAEDKNRGDWFDT